jgi:hypothetical protein
MNVKIIDPNKKRNDFELYHKTGGARTNYAGFECLNGVFRFALDGVTDITGLPHSGKTEFALEILFYQSETFGIRHLLYAPDIGSYNEIRRKLFVKYYKRSFRGYDNSITNAEVIHASAWIDTHFLIATKEDAKKPIMPEELWQFTTDYEDVNGIVHTCFIDSWKNLFHDMSPYGGREDLYLDYILSYRNELAELKNRHFMTIAHPKKMEFMNSQNGSKPKRRVPDADDIKGGSAWNSNGKVIISVDYPDRTKQTVDIYFCKVKPDTIGKVKVLMEELEFDYRKSRYRETIESKMYYAGEGQKAKQQGEFIGIAGMNNDIIPTPF